jgi:PAS domain S-box-containing protein
MASPNIMTRKQSMKQSQTLSAMPILAPPKSAVAAGGFAYLLGYLVLDAFSTLFQIHSVVSIWHPAVGLSLGLIICFGAPLAPLLFLANLLSCVLIRQHALEWHTVFFSLIHACGYTAAGEIVRRLIPDRLLATTSAAVRYMLVALVAPLPVALTSCLVIVLTGTLTWSAYLPNVLAWWLGDGIGLMVITPLMLVYVSPWFRDQYPFQQLYRLLQGVTSISWLHISAQTLGILLTVWLVFFSSFANQQAYFICFIPVVWITLRSGILGATFVVWLLSFAAMYAAATTGIPQDQLIRFQLLMMALSITGLSLGAAVTEQHQLAAVLKQSETRIRAVVDQQLDLVCRYSMDLHLTFVNDAYCQFFGCTNDSLIGKSFLPLTRPEYHRTILQQAARIIEHREVIVDESLIYRHDGSLRWMQWINRAIVDQYGHVVEVQVVGRDITQRRQAEEAYRSLVDHSLQGLAIIQDQHVVFVNPAICAILGYSLEGFRAIGNPIKLVHPSHQAAIERLLFEVQTPGVQQSTEARVLCGDGSYCWLQIYLTATIYNNSEAIMAVALDSTARREAEAALQHSEERYRIISELTSDYAWAYSRNANGELKPSWTAGAFTRITGYTSEELDLKGGWSSIVYPADLPMMIANRTKQELGISYEQDLRIIRRDGDIRWLHTVVKPHLDPATGDVSHLYGAVRDITEQKQAEEVQRAVDRRIQETQKLESIGLLAGGIAHDFNNLLVGVLGNAGMALAELPTDSPTRETIHYIEVAANHGAELTRQLLAYAGKGSIRIRTIEINTLIEEMIQLLKIGIPRRVDLVPQLSNEALEVTGDLTQIRQVLMNIVINAAEAIGQEDGTITITTGTQWFDQNNTNNVMLTSELPSGQYVTIKVEDTGVGMDHATRDRIFEPFFSTKVVGRGLGLAAVLGIVRSHQGAIQIESTLGHGSTFLVYLPQNTPTEAIKPPELDLSDHIG